MWPSERHAVALPYRSASVPDTFTYLDELLELLSVHDHSALLRRRATHVRGKLTWARLASLAVDLLSKKLIRGREVERALLLGERLAERDREKHARVTTETRDAIARLTFLARALAHATELLNGDTPTELRVYSLLGLHQRWEALRRSLTLSASDARRARATILALVQQAVGAVLQSDAHASLKGIASKALSRWTPSEVSSAHETVGAQSCNDISLLL